MDTKLESTRDRFAIWPMTLGVFLILVGIIALARPVATTLSLAWMLGLMFLSVGVVQLAHSFALLRERGRVGRFLVAGLSIVTGLIMLRSPVVGAFSLTVVLTFYLLASAIGKGLFAIELKPMKGWGWMVLSSVVSCILGLYLLAALPLSSLIVPATFFGIDMLMYGFSFLALALSLRRVSRTREKTESELSQRRAA